jgi:putative DNA primase/helicase
MNSIEGDAMSNDQIISMIEKQILKFEEFSTSNATPAEAKNNRPAIILQPGEIHISTTLAEQALLSNEFDLFQRAGKLVRVVRAMTKPIKDQSYIKRSNEALIIAEVDFIYLTELLSRAADWQRYDIRQKGLKLVDCPERIAKTLIARKEWSLPVLSGIIQAPTLRLDGSILEVPGYDEETGLFFNPGHTMFPKIEEYPTLSQAEQALHLLMNLLKDFPFEDESSRSVAISAILTALIRKSIRTAPLHGFTAPKMSSGKSLLADIVGLVATGKSNSFISQAENEAEEAKRLLAVLLEGDSIVCYDNIERPFGSAALCTVLTEVEYKDRILGESKNIGVPTNATFLATGNNLTFVGDISTRAILCRIDPKEEHPEERKFDIDLRQYIPQYRGEIVQSCLTILRAYHIAGRPKQDIKQFGRFEEWSDWVRSALVWLGIEDPCKSRRNIEEADPVRMALGNLLMAWHAIFGDLSVRVKDVVKRAYEETSEAHEALKDALADIATDSRGNLNQKMLGNKLSAFRNRVENGLRLESKGTLQGYTLWQVKKV